MSLYVFCIFFLFVLARSYITHEVLHPQQLLLLLPQLIFRSCADLPLYKEKKEKDSVHLPTNKVLELDIFQYIVRFDFVV